jgi:hypothetical protein
MIVPEYWAEACQKCRRSGRQMTIRRWGWSNESQAAAQAMADSRIALAIAQWSAGGKVLQREPKIPYNGAQGLPIREEILARHGDTVITRNSYGARCLNTPDVLFADIDFDPEKNKHLLFSLIFFVICFVAGGLVRGPIGLMMFLFAGLGTFLTLVGFLEAWRIRIPSSEKNALAKIDHFLAYHPDWALRVYRTPAGLRLMATHRLFRPGEDEVKDFFVKVGADPLFAQMCANQKCFRARLSAKPWRIGITSHMKPRPGVWPVSPDRLNDRITWVAAYERHAQNYAACQFMLAVGSGRVDLRLAEVLALHDAESRALVPGLNMG